MEAEAGGNQGACRAVEGGEGQEEGENWQFSREMTCLEEGGRTPSSTNAWHLLTPHHHYPPHTTHTPPTYSPLQHTYSRSTYFSSNDLLSLSRTFFWVP